MPFAAVSSSLGGHLISFLVWRRQIAVGFKNCRSPQQHLTPALATTDKLHPIYFSKETVLLRQVTTEL